MAPNRNAQTAVLGSIAGGTWQPCLLTWYDPALGGTNSSSGRADPHSATASGEPYDPNAYTCAAPPQYPFGTTVSFLYNATTVTCRVNDRGGAITGAHFDLSRRAATDLGIINSGRVNASFQVGGTAGAPSAANAATGASNSGGNGGGGGGPDVLSIISDLLTGNFQDLATQVAIGAVDILKDITMGVVDWVVIPWWQWNQRAAQYYWDYELMPTDKAVAEEKWTVLPWTAAFWGLGYWLFWTDPDNPAGGMKPAPVRRSRAARHVRSLQAIPARRELIKPSRVKEKTAKKPKPVASRAPIARVDTMSVTRTLPVRVQRAGQPPRQDGRSRDNGITSEIPVEREGTRTGETASERRNIVGSPPDSADATRTAPGSAAPRRARERSLPSSGNGASGDTGPRRDAGDHT